MSTLITGPVLLSFPHVFVPQENQSGKLKYSVKAYLAYPGRDDIDKAGAVKFVREYFAAAKPLAEAKWPGVGSGRVTQAAINTYHMAEGGAKEVLEEALGKLVTEGKAKLGFNFKFGLRVDRGAKEKDPEGVLFFSASSDDAPGIVSRYADPATKKARRITDPKEMYGGVIARLSVNVGAIPVEENQGMTMYLNNIQKWADGVRVGGGRPAAEAEFDAEMEAEMAFGDNPEDMENVLG